MTYSKQNAVLLADYRACPFHSDLPVVIIVWSTYKQGHLIELEKLWRESLDSKIDRGINADLLPLNDGNVK